MRGVVTLAAVFAIPEDVPHRPVLVLAALVVVGGTLILQGFTLPALVRLLKVRGTDPREDLLQQAVVLQETADAGLAALERERVPDDPPDVVRQPAAADGAAPAHRLGAARPARVRRRDARASGSGRCG